MTRYNTLNVKLSRSQLNKWKLRIKSGTEVNFNLSSDVIGNSQKKLLTITQVLKLRKAFAYNSLPNI